MSNKWYSALITYVLNLPAEYYTPVWQWLGDIIFSYLQCHHTTLIIDWMIECQTNGIQRWSRLYYTPVVWHWFEWYLFSYLQCHHTTLNIDWMVFSADHVCITPQSCHWLSGVCFHIYSVIIQRLSLIECQTNGIQRWSRLYYTPVVWHWLSDICFHIYSVIIQRLTLIEWYSALITSVLHASRVALVEWRLLSHLQCHHTTLNIDWMVFSADHVCITRQSCGTGWVAFAFTSTVSSYNAYHWLNGIQRWSRLYYTPVVWHWLSGVCFHIYSVIIQRLTLIEWYSALITSVLHASRVALVEWRLLSHLQCHHTTLNIDWMVFSADHVCITRQSCGTGWVIFVFISTVSSYNA